ncbi:hypothetical protein E3Q08_00007 [Wallemia mellicola]|nr:hypothetical protein E3Q08_00007 [Wallemia mellicola]
MNLFNRNDDKFITEVINATNEENKDEPYDLYFDLLDKLQSDDVESNSKLVIQQIHKRLSHRNLKTQLLSLKLVDFLLKNTNPPISIQKEVASLSFTQSLQRLILDRNSDQELKYLTTKLVYTWADDFDNSNDSTTLGLMREVADNLANQNIYPQQENSRPRPPSPDYQKLKQEEDELQKVLEMSKMDIGGRFNQVATSPSLPSTSTQSHTFNTQQQPTSASPPPPVTKTSSNEAPQRVKALYDFEPQEANELGFLKGDVITVLESIHKDWWRGELSGEIGIFPVNYIQVLPNLTPSQISSEAQVEAQLFDSAGDIDRLLRLLQDIDPASGDNIADNDEIQDLYDKTLRLRPKIVKLIEKYSRKKDELVAINNRFNQARDLFAGMMERPSGYPQQPAGAGAVYQQAPAPQQYTYPQQAPAQQYYQPGPYDEQWAQYYAAQAAAQQADGGARQAISPNQFVNPAASNPAVSPYAQLPRQASPYAQHNTLLYPQQTSQPEVNIVDATPVSPPAHHLGSTTSLDNQFANGHNQPQGGQQPHY